MKRFRRLWWLILLFPLFLGVTRLRFDVEVLNLLPDDIPVVSGLKLYQRHFAGSDELLITVSAHDADTAADTASDLCLLLRTHTNLVARVLWQPPLKEHPEQMSELLAALWLNQPPEVFRQLASRLAADNLVATLAATRDALATSLSPDDLARLGYDPFGLSRLPGAQGGFGQGEQMFTSADGKFRLIFVKPADAAKSYREAGEWLLSVRSIAENFLSEASQSDRVQFGFTGAPAFVAEISSDMEKDMAGSAAGTLVVVAVLFRLVHRRWMPMLWLVVSLALITAVTLSLGGLIFGTLNVVSLGFAAILIGLTVDYALVLYQEASGNPGATAGDVRREMSGGILWSALTTSCAFALLNFAGLPGLGQLGTLVALGIALGAGVMLFWFLPLAVRVGGVHVPATAESQGGGGHAIQGHTSKASAGVRTSALNLKVKRISIVLVMVSTAMLAWRFPSLDHSPEALSSVGSQANAAMEQIKSHLVQTNEPLWLLVTGSDENEVGGRLDQLAARINSPGVRRWFGEATLPDMLWMRPERQQANRSLAASLAARGDEFRSALREAGFTDDAFKLTEGILQTWKRALNSGDVFTPTNDANRWLLEKCSARTADGWMAMGIVQPATNATAAFGMANQQLGEAFSKMGVILTGWPVLGEALLEHTERRLPWVAAAMVMFVAVCLWFAFRSIREVLLSFFALALSFVLLLTGMSMCGWSWNLLNLMAVPLLLGAGVDYTIHVQLGLRRHHGDAAAMRRTTGRALLLCAGTTIVGFGSLTWAGNAGLASLGKVCAAGMVCMLFVSVCLMPAWWQVAKRKPGDGEPRLSMGSDAPERIPADDSRRSNPSSFYGAWLWSVGLIVARLLPAGVCEVVARTAVALYWHMAPHRREVVIQNLLPVLNGNRGEARRAARRLFANFATKVSDLWRFEGGTPVDTWLGKWSGWEIYQAANARGRGVLFVTPHLGNWEFGGAFMAKKGVKMLVLTQAEPDERLTELRQESRARWGIETLVVGQDAFAFVEIIQRLHEGATVALLVDRPSAARAVTVELFGRPFAASNAAAELARASGCAIVPVCVVRNDGHYAARILPEIRYDRAAIGSREARIELTQEILRALEPAIRQHVEQWFHFVPVWPR